MNLRAGKPGVVKLGGARFAVEAVVDAVSLKVRNCGCDLDDTSFPLLVARHHFSGETVG